MCFTQFNSLNASLFPKYPPRHTEKYCLGSRQRAHHGPVKLPHKTNYHALLRELLRGAEVGGLFTCVSVLSLLTPHFWASPTSPPPDRWAR